MKKLLLVFLIFECGFTFGNINFPDSAATWTISSIGWGHCDSVRSFRVINDSLINNTRYKTIYVTKDSVFNLKKSIYFCSVKDSANRWYFIFKGKSKPVMLYDFNLKAGDTISIVNYSGSPQKIKIISIDSINCLNQKRKRLNIGRYDSKDEMISESWIEGIGSTNGLFYSSVFYMDAGWELTCYRQNDELVYAPYGKCGCLSSISASIEKKNIEVFPNPFDNYVNIQFSRHYQLIKLYDNRGILINSITVENNVGSIRMDLSGIPGGIYYLNLVNANSTETVKLIKEK
jgi:hypothetical protein